MKAPRYSAFLLAVQAFALAGCSPASEARPSVPWRGEVDRDGAVTTVRTLESSVWPGPARLIEEQSIGVGEGAEPYMLGSVAGLDVADGLVYVADRSIPVVRVYDEDGLHVRDIGSDGEGPGEFRRISGVGVAAGRVFVHDLQAHRMVVFDLQGRPLNVYPTRSGFMSSHPLVVTADGTPHVYDMVDRFAEHPFDQYAMVPYGPDGEVGELVRPWPAKGEISRLTGPGPPCASLPVPLAPDEVFTMASSGAVLSGYSGEYRIHVLRPDGSRLVIERELEPVPIPSEHREYERRRTRAFNRYACGVNWEWVGPGIPSVKPYFESLIPAHDGGLWVVRPVESEHRPGRGCDQELNPSGEVRPGPSCWRSRRAIDAFDADGRFLGEVQLPPDVDPRFLHGYVHVEGERVWLVATDRAGVIQVRRYRLEPGR